MYGAVVTVCMVLTSVDGKLMLVGMVGWVRLVGLVYGRAVTIASLCPDWGGSLLDC